MESTCKLCLVVDSDLRNVSTLVGASVFVIIEKLFSIRFEDQKDAIHVCVDCYDLLSKCNRLYEKVQAAQCKLNANEILVDIKQEVVITFDCKTEFRDVDCDDYYEDYKDTKEDYYGSSDDDVPIIKTINKNNDNKANVKLVNTKASISKVKKTSKTKKKPGKIKAKVEKLDTNELLNQNGAFTVTGKVLSALIEKFYKKVCEVCKMDDFTTIKQLFRHYDEKHSSKGFILCCGKTLAHKQDLKYHMAWHIQPSAFECKTCKKVLARPTDVKHHEQSHLPNKERPYQCAHCGKGYIFLNKLKKHLRTHDEEEGNFDGVQKRHIKTEVKKEDSESDKNVEIGPKPLINQDGVFTVKGPALHKLLSEFYNMFCQMCSEAKQFKNLTDLFDHYADVHRVKGYVTCCDIQLDHRKYINYHMAKHLQPSAFECHICKKTVSRPGELKFHIQHHLPDSQKPLQCDECGKGFVYLNTFKKHKLTHVPLEKREIYECKYCDKRFNILTSYSVHVSQKHSGPSRLCSQCGKTIKGKKNYMRHLKQHEPNENKEAERVKCPDCGISIANMEGLRKHMRRHVTTMKCEQCDYIARSNTQMKKHVMVRHTDLKPHVCMICNKGFKLKHSMKVHMAQHTGERNYTCPYCPRTFMDPANCYSHQKKMHPIELKNSPRRKKVFT